MIEKVSYAPHIELFAREKHEGWDAWGERGEGRSLCSNPKCK